MGEETIHSCQRVHPIEIARFTQDWARAQSLQAHPLASESPVLCISTVADMKPSFQRIERREKLPIHESSAAEYYFELRDENAL
jgi:hypothetical protein